MPQPLKAYTNVTVYGEQGKENQDRMLKMMNGLEDNLDNLSYDLKKRFKNLVVSQLSLLRYRGKDFDIKSLNVDANENTTQARNRDESPLHRRTNKDIDVLKRGNLNNGNDNVVRLRNKNVLKSNDEVNKDDYKLSAKFKEAVTEMKKRNDASTTYDKSYLNKLKNKKSTTIQNMPKDMGSLYSNKNGTKYVPSERFIPNNKRELRRERCSHGVNFRRKKDFPYGITHAAHIETNMPRPNFAHSQDLGEKDHRNVRTYTPTEDHRIVRTYNPTKDGKHELNFDNSTVTQVKYEIQPSREMLDGKSNEHKDEIINETIQRQNHGMCKEKRGSDVNYLEFKYDTNNMEKETDVANRSLSPQELHLKQETLDDILSSGLTVEEYLRLIVNGLNENDFLDYRGNETRSPAISNINEEKLDNILDQTKPIKAYTKLIQNDMLDDKSQVNKVNDGCVSQETDDNAKATNRRASTYNDEIENKDTLYKRYNDIALQERHKYQSKQTENCEPEDELGEKNKSSYDHRPNNDLSYQSHQNSPVSLFQTDASQGTYKTAKVKDEKSPLRLQRNSQVVSHVKDSIFDNPPNDKPYQHDQKTKTENNLQKAKFKDSCGFDEMVDHDNLVTHIVQPYQDMKNNAPKANTDNMPNSVYTRNVDKDGDNREYGGFWDKDTAYLEKDDGQKNIDPNSDLNYKRAQNKRFKEGTRNKGEEPFKTTKSPGGLIKFSDTDCQKKPDSRRDSIASAPVSGGSSKSTTTPHLTPVTILPSSNELTKEIPKTMISQELYGRGKVYGRKNTNKPINDMSRSNSPEVIMNPEKTLNTCKDEKVVNHELKCTETPKRIDMAAGQIKEHIKDPHMMKEIFENTGARPKEPVVKCETSTGNSTNEQELNVSTREKLQDSITSESTSFVFNRIEDDSAYHTLYSIPPDQSTVVSQQQTTGLSDTCNQSDISSNEPMGITDKTCLDDKNTFDEKKNKPNLWISEDIKTSTPKCILSQLHNIDREELNQHDKQNKLIHFTRNPVEQNKYLADLKPNYPHIVQAEITTFYTEQQANCNDAIKDSLVKDITDISDLNVEQTDASSSTKPKLKTHEFTQDHLRDDYSTQSFTSKTKKEPNVIEANYNQSPTTSEELKEDDNLTRQSFGVPRDIGKDTSSTRNISQIKNLKENTGHSNQQSSVSLKTTTKTREDLLKENNVKSKLLSNVIPGQSLIDRGNIILHSTTVGKPSADVPMGTSVKEEYQVKDEALDSADGFSYDWNVPAHRVDDQDQQSDRDIPYTDKFPVEVILSPRIRKMNRILRGGIVKTPDFEIIDKNEIKEKNDINDQEINSCDILVNKVTDRFKESKEWLDKNAHFDRGSFGNQIGRNQEKGNQSGGKHKSKSARSGCTESSSKKSETQYDWKGTSQLHRTNEMLFLMENLMTENLPEHERFELWNEVQNEIRSLTKNLSEALTQQLTYRAESNIKLKDAETDLKMMIDPENWTSLDNIVTRLKMAATGLAVLDRDRGLLFEHKDMLLRLKSLSNMLQVLSSRHHDADEDANTHEHDAIGPTYHPIKILDRVSGAVKWPFRTLRSFVRPKEQGKTTDRVSQKLSSAMDTDMNRPSTSYEGNHCNARNGTIEELRDNEMESDIFKAHGIKSRSTGFEDPTCKTTRTKETKREFFKKHESVRNKERVGVDAQRLETGLDTEGVAKDVEQDVSETCIKLTNRISATFGHTDDTSVRFGQNHARQQLRERSYVIRQISWISRSPEYGIIIAFTFGFILGALFIFFGPDLLGFVEQAWLKFTSFIICNCKLVHTASPFV